MIKIIKTQFIIPLLVTICGLMGALYFFFDDFFLLFFPVCILSLLALPLVLRVKVDVFSMWSWMFYSSILGILLRCTYIYFDIPDRNSIDDVFLLGHPKASLFPAMLLIFFGILFMVLGYVLTNIKVNLKGRIYTNSNWDKKKFFYTAVTLMVISIISLAYFIKLEGGLLSAASLSGYRGVSDTLAEAAPHSYLRLLVSFSGINLFLLTAWLIRHKSFKTLTYVLWVISFLTFMFFNFYVSQRGAIVFTLVQLTALSYYLNNFKLPKVKLLAGVIVALVLFQIMSAIRAAKNVQVDQIKFSFAKAIEPAILTTNMIDVSKTAHIMDAIPGKLDYQYGATLTTVFLAWIPREIWANKPVTNVDNIIGMKVFGATTYGSGGVPPGMIAELYWNFWIPGVIIGCFLIGFLLKIINQTILSNITNPNMIIIYVVNFMFLGLSVIGSSFSSMLVGILETLLPLLLVLYTITEKKEQLI